MTDKDTELTPSQEAELDAFFAAARAAEPAPSADLVARILADAESHLPRPSLLSRLRSSLAPIGGLPGLSALTACALFGLGLGYSGTTTIDTMMEPMALSGAFDLDDAVSYFSIDTATFDELEG